MGVSPSLRVAEEFLGDVVQNPLEISVIRRRNVEVVKTNLVHDRACLPVRNPLEHARPLTLGIGCLTLIGRDGAVVDVPLDLVIVAAERALEAGARGITASLDKISAITTGHFRIIVRGLHLHLSQDFQCIELADRGGKLGIQPQPDHPIEPLIYSLPQRLRAPVVLFELGCPDVGPSFFLISATRLLPLATTEPVRRAYRRRIICVQYAPLVYS